MEADEVIVEVHKETSQSVNMDFMRLLFTDPVQE